MADNFEVSQGEGTEIAADEVSSVKYQRVKPVHSVDGAAPVDTSASNPLPTIPTSNVSIGDLPFSNLGATNTGTTPFTAAVCISELTFTNADAAARTIKLYDKSSAATSADTPIRRVTLGANASLSMSFPKGLKFSNGLSIRATSEVTDAGTTGAAANTIIVSGAYKQ